MKFLYKMERKFGRFAIKNLMLHITILNAIVYLTSYLFTTFSLVSYMALVPNLVMQGQVWRIITYVFVPPNVSIILTAITLYFYYFIGLSLEHRWGSFKFNVYYLLGIILTAAASMISGYTIVGTYLNLSLFFAFAMLYPNMEVLFFFVIPIKVKYLAYFDAAFYAYVLIKGTPNDRIAIIGSLLNFFIFFGPDIYKMIKLRIKVMKNRSRYR
ncbi:MAG: rhomboid family intramembrane serine protease [Eubacteriaceae bacterium]|nr:rhomboid family intramembrane serine protease [Eubacteriaceae bacterium]